MTRRPIIAAQAVYYISTGAWAVAHRRSFEAVTGRKPDYWLVRTVGLLATAIGAALAVAARSERSSAESGVLAVGAGAAFSLVDVVCVARRRVDPIYLGDAALHAALAAAALRGEPRRSRARPGGTRRRSRPPAR
jgi:ABC-type cobalamin transport system permease subunit